MDTPFFSIVIPVYNGLTHNLPTCLNSIWSQSLDKEAYEVICVDDCSTDGTRQWLKEEQSKHPNLRVIENEKNVRQGGSRNKGVRAASGKYIIFIDQDDYYHEESITAAYNHLQKEILDILIVDCAYQSPGKVSNKLQHKFPHREIMTGDEIIEKNSIPYAPWKFIFMRSHMIDKELFFAENERIEDVDWVHKLVHYAQRVQYQPILFIHYNKTSISTTMTSYKSRETVYSTLRLSKRMHNMLNTDFATSNANVKAEVERIANMMGYIGIRSYLFLYDSVKEKERNIKENLCGERNRNLLMRVAQRMPALFSFASNLISPFGNLAMYIYRNIKYNI